MARKPTIQQKYESLEAAVIKLANILTSLDERLSKQETKKLTLSAVGTTDRNFGHDHKITLTLTEK